MNKKSTLLVKIDGVNEHWVVYYTVRENERKVYAISNKSTFPFNKLIVDKMYTILCTQTEEGWWQWDAAYQIDEQQILIK